MHVTKCASSSVYFQCLPSQCHLPPSVYNAISCVLTRHSPVTRMSAVNVVERFSCWKINAILLPTAATYSTKVLSRYNTLTQATIYHMRQIYTSRTHPNSLPDTTRIRWLYLHSAEVQENNAAWKGCPFILSECHDQQRHLIYKPVRRHA